MLHLAFLQLPRLDKQFVVSWHIICFWQMSIAFIIIIKNRNDKNWKEKKNRKITLFPVQIKIYFY